MIKVMVSGGEMTPGGPPMWQSQFSTEQVRAAVDEARAGGVPVAAHAYGVGGVASAIAAGVDTVEHCSWLTDELAYAPQTEVAEAMAYRGVAVCPTHGSNWPEFAARIGWERAEQIFSRVPWLDRLGVPLLAGTDAGLPGAGFDDLAASLGFFAHLGFDTERSIEFATINPATALGLGETTGQLAPGFSADLLVTRGDALTDLAAVGDIELVLARGRPRQPPAPTATAG